MCAYCFSHFIPGPCGLLISLISGAIWASSFPHFKEKCTLVSLTSGATWASSFLNFKDKWALVSFTSGATWASSVPHFKDHVGSSFSLQRLHGPQVFLTSGTMTCASSFSHFMNHGMCASSFSHFRGPCGLLISLTSGSTWASSFPHFRKHVGL